MVKSVKKALYSRKEGTLGEHPVTKFLSPSWLKYSEAEFMVNSRQLTFVAGDAEDAESAISNHFLLGKDY
jgi:hypothetical protein